MNHSLSQSTNSTTTEIFEAMFSTRQACRILGVSRPTLIKLVMAGTVPAIRVGRSWKYKPSALRAFMDGAKPEELK